MPIYRKHKRKSFRSKEAGFTLIEMVIVLVLASILGIFVFGTLTKCLVAQRNMQNRKERSDDAIMALERINRDFREADWIYSTVTNRLMFRKKITSSADRTDLFIKYQRNTTTNVLTRHSDTSVGASGASTIGDIIATNVSFFKAGKNSFQRAKIELEFDDGSDWTSYIFYRNFGL